VALPAALGGRYSTGYYDLSDPAQHWVSTTQLFWELVPGPALLVSQVLCGGRCPLDPLTWRTTLGTGHAGCKAVVAPARR
jgi:hypothetical protein